MLFSSPSLFWIIVLAFQPLIKSLIFAFGDHGKREAIRFSEVGRVFCEVL